MHEIPKNDTKMVVFADASSQQQSDDEGYTSCVSVGSKYSPINKKDFYASSVRVNDKQTETPKTIRILCDSGANINLARPELSTKLNLRVNDSSMRVETSGDEMAMESAGEADVLINFGSTSLPMKMILAGKLRGNSIVWHPLPYGMMRELHQYSTKARLCYLIRVQ